MRRTVLTAQVKKQKLPELQIIARDNCWYVAELGIRTKWRPYETPFLMHAAYFFLLRGEPRFLTDGPQNRLGDYEGTKDGVATFLTPVSGSMRKQLEFSVRGLEDVIRQKPALASDPDSIRAIEQMRRMLRGIAVRIDLASGMYVQLGSADRQTEIQDFKWLDHVAPDDFATDQYEWEHHSDDPTQGPSDDLLMISHNPTWQPGMKSGESDGLLLNVRTGRYRRIPFHGIVSLPGCFSKDRRRVIVSGLDDSTGTLQMYEIDLKTGNNRPLGGDALAGGNSLMPALSLDGKTIAVIHKKPEGRPLDSQIYLIDLRSGDAKPLGKPADVAFLSWLPDRQGLLLLKRESADPSNLSLRLTDTIARLGMDGQTTRLLDGSMPVVLNDGKTVLFKGPSDRSWQTCDLDGKNVRPFANGLTDYGFPSPAPDGKRIIWTHFIRGAAPVPTILPIGENSGKAAIKSPGLWSLPSWR
ncbi:MAG TPA: hypothetical protein VFG04_28995 [Planctomycetaceae bacterium]|nr:hypothetical protein [Planctomycetaceae bacterium]